MFIPTTIEEVRQRGWDRLDVILVTGDTYIDCPSMGVSIIGHLLMDEGLRVGIIAQPDTEGPDDIARLGEPLLYWGVSSGAVDSMVSNYNADRSRRKQDDLTPGGENNSRPDRACIAYTGLIRRYFRNTVPVVLGGVEASLRRVAHYDYWQNSIRRSILFDAKADIIVYGMGELASVSLAAALAEGRDHTFIPGTCFISATQPEDALVIPSFEEVSADSSAFERMFDIFYRNSGSHRGRRLAQRHGDRWLVHNPPARNLDAGELDRVYGLPYERDTHPYYGRRGEVRALDTIRFSITTHRGCFGGCNFCSIAIHQGQAVISRTEESIVREAVNMTRHRSFRGTISDVGGPTGNMYGMGCAAMEKGGGCAEKGCLVPSPCPSLKPDHRRQISLLRRLRQLPGVKHVFVASGIRYDLVLADRQNGEAYLEELLRYHVSGLMRIAPEHTVPGVLEIMGKPFGGALEKFHDLFERVVRKTGRDMSLSYYLMAAHPGCTQQDMEALERDTSARWGRFPGKVQIFTPTPSTWSTLMYYTGRDPFSGKDLFVERDMGRKTKQRNVIDTFRKKPGVRKKR